jgi:hypothetical protein
MMLSGHGMSSASSYHHRVALVLSIGNRCHARWMCGAGSRYAKVYREPPDGFRPCPKCYAEAS